MTWMRKKDQDWETWARCKQSEHEGRRGWKQAGRPKEYSGWTGAKKTEEKHDFETEKKDARPVLIYVWPERWWSAYRTTSASVLLLEFHTKDIFKRLCPHWILVIGQPVRSWQEPWESVAATLYDRF